jgi:hypothetical protein
VPVRLYLDSRDILVRNIQSVGIFQSEGNIPVQFIQSVGAFQYTKLFSPWGYFSTKAPSLTNGHIENDLLLVFQKRHCCLDTKSKCQYDNEGSPSKVVVLNMPDDEKKYHRTRLAFKIQEQRYK